MGVNQELKVLYNLYKKTGGGSRDGGRGWREFRGGMSTNNHLRLKEHKDLKILSPQPRSDANFCFTRGDFSRLSE